MAVKILNIKKICSHCFECGKECKGNVGYLTCLFCDLTYCTNSKKYDNITYDAISINCYFDIFDPSFKCNQCNEESKYCLTN